MRNSPARRGSLKSGLRAAKNVDVAVDQLLNKLQMARDAFASLVICGCGERRRRGNNHHETSEGSSSPSPSSSLRATPNEWTFAFDTVINDGDGRALFTKFLQSEYSEENILFWWAVQELKSVTDEREQFEQSVQEMYETFIAADSPLAINIDHDTRMEIIDRVTHLIPADLPENIFDRAQAHVYRLMEKDCFSRFVHTQPYKDLAKRLSLPQTFRFNGRLSPV